ncbi:DUF4112 domain-containing protein [Salisaeta longa]|uniref:DUF4112 domain-containing protein n=1 Tax=Salisaeta longa TaxID=503170 RepID=UPI0003B35536|nr:DUF4112 domain-containing protein [Salisaeta longa]
MTATATRSSDTAAVIERLDTFATWTDEVFRIPFTPVRFGLESLLSLIPVAGDYAGLLVSSYVPIEAIRQGAPWRLVAQMIARSVLDALVGLIPVLGDAFDVWYKANRRNADALIDWLEQHA